jgi:hypothetical protein
MQYTLEQKNAIIGQHLKTAAGRNFLAASLQQPLRDRRDYASVGRKTFLVEQLPDGALAIYDKDPDIIAYVIGEEGANIQSIAKSRRVQFPLFELAANPEIPLTQVKERRFDIIERSQKQAVSQIQAAEDQRVFAIMDAVATAGFDSLPGQLNPDIAAAAPLNTAVLADAFSLVERHDLAVSRVYMNARDYADLRKIGRDTYDFNTQRALLDTGIRDIFWGAHVVTSRLVPVGTVYVCTEPEHFGRMPVRTELTVLSADNPKDRKIGFSIFEQLGIGCFNPRGLARIIVAR